MSIRTFARDNGLSLVVFGLFIVFIAGMSVVGWRVANDELVEHGQPPESYASYLVSGEFIEATFENWESEFLQMWALVMLTIWLRQKGSEDSKPMHGRTKQDNPPRRSLRAAHTWQQYKKAAGYWLYSHSLGLALLSLFVLSFGLHAWGGTEAYNQEARQHGQETVNVWSYMATSQFWFESLQNWQSEFLAVGALTVLSIRLRERGSPQSKPVGKKYDHKTGP